VSLLRKALATEPLTPSERAKPGVWKKLGLPEVAVDPETQDLEDEKVTKLFEAFFSGEENGYTDAEMAAWFLSKGIAPASTVEEDSSDPKTRLTKSQIDEFSSDKTLSPKTRANYRCQFGLFLVSLAKYN
jgi:hypothetical protein